MNLMDLFVNVRVDDQATSQISKITWGIGKGLSTAAKIGTAAVGAAATGIAALTKASINQYAEYEQLVGGVDTLFKDSSQKLQQYAADAYKTAGMSANDYMANATAFSASLISSLGGDTEAAAEYANRAMVSMSDNANKMGTSIDSIVATYQSLSRGNMAMLDNLKLGYGGTKSELQRLLKDAASYTDVQKEMGIAVDASSMSFDNIVNAIAVVQGHLGIAGATALEAGTTIEGSVMSMKSAWQNLITGIADGNADIGTLVDNLVTTVVGDGTESNLGVLGNILPAVERALNGAATLVAKGLPPIIERIPSIVQENLPVLLEAAVGMVEGLVTGIIDNQESLFDAIITTVNYLAESFLSLLPQIVKLGLDLIVSLATGIADSLPELIPTIVDVILQIVDTITDPTTLGNLLTAAFAIITSIATYLVQPDVINQLLDSAIDVVKNLAQFVMENLGPMLDAAIDIIMALVNYLLEPSNLAKLVQTAIELIVTIAGAMIGATNELVKAAGELILALVDKFKATDWQKIGKDLVAGFKKGIQNAWGNLKSWFRGLFGDLIGIAKRILGIASPSKVFKQIGGFTAEGFGEGFDDEFAGVKDDMENALAFDDLDIGTSVHRIESVTGSTEGKPGRSGYIGGESEVQRMFDRLVAELAANQGDIIIPVYVGDEQIEEVIINAQRRVAVKSGGLANA